MLICPKCKQQLHKIDHSYQCEMHHTFDIAKRGYVNLMLGNAKGSGDDKEMIGARSKFLSHGYYQPLCERLIQIIREVNPSILVDAGCGEGFYTNQLKEAVFEGSVFGFDLSKFGIDEACKAKRDIFYGVCSVFHMPLSDACADAVLSVFAPVDEKETARVLKDGGYLIKVGPGPKHLLELKQIVYEQVYENDIAEHYNQLFVMAEEMLLEYTIDIDKPDDIWSLFQMTPYYWKSPRVGCDRLRQQQTLQTQVQFRIEIYRKKRME